MAPFRPAAVRAGRGCLRGQSAGPRALGARGRARDRGCGGDL